MFLSVSMGFPDKFIIVGNDGPNISASKSPTSFCGKCRLIARAKFTAEMSD